MPLISQNLPAYTNDNCGGSTQARWANDNDYDFGWRSCDTPSTTAPTYLAYDLSSVPAAKRGPALVVWYNDPATLVYDFSYKGVHPYCCWDPYDIPKDYTLEANAGPGGTLPTANWVTLATVTGNKYHSRQAAVDLTGYNWLRLNVTATYGVTNAYGVVANMDIHDASAGYQDDWIFYGDSITEGSMHHYDGASNVGSFGQMIHAANPSHFPAQEAASIGGTLSVDGVTSINTWLPMFAGRYVAIAYGTNDAGWDVTPTDFYNNYVTMVQAVINAGKVPIVPHIPWGCTSQIQRNVPTLNQKIDALYTAFPQIVRGPDLWAYFQANQNLISPDCVHPTEPGYWAMRQTWANAMLNAVYAPPPALTISGVQVSNIGATSAVISWQTTNAATSTVNYGTTATYDSAVNDSASVTNHSLTLSGLAGNTTYHYQVASTDTFGQTASSQDDTFTTIPVAGAASRLVLTGAASATAGAAFSFTVTAQDDAGNTASAYTGTVHFTSTDTSAGVVLPANTTLTNGQGTFSATLTKAGAQTITATDTATPTITGTLSVTIRAAAAAQMFLTAPSTATALQPFNVTVTLKDRYGNLATGYVGSVHFTSSDLLATLPADYTFTAADAGRHQFSVTLATPPSQTISVRDVANPSLGTTSGMITVTVAVPGL
jgi:lysophospholipase L1-like esterase